MIRALILSLLCVTAQAQTAHEAAAADVATTGIGLALGVAVGMQRWDAGADERLFWAICADERTRNPRLTCEFTKPT